MGSWIGGEAVCTRQTPFQTSAQLEKGLYDVGGWYIGESGALASDSPYLPLFLLTTRLSWLCRHLLAASLTSALPVAMGTSHHCV